MSMDEDRIRLVLELTGSDTVEHATAKLAELKTETTALDVSMAGLGGTMKPSGNLGQGLLQGSYAIQDFTSQLGTRGLAGALGAVQNNIPGILASMGAGAGLAGVISVVAVGAGALYENWDKLSGLFGKTKEKIPELKEGLEGLKESIKEIGDSIEKLEKQAKEGGLNLFDTEKLATLRGLKKEGEQRESDEKLVSGIGGNASKRSREVQAAVKTALAEAGGGDVTAENLAMNTGMSGRDATAVVADAIRGNTSALKELMQGAPTFATQYNIVSPEAKERNERAKKGLKEEGEFQNRRLKEIEQANREKKADQDNIDQTLIEDAQLNERELEKDKREREQADRIKEREAKAAARQAEKAADPLEQLRKIRDENEGRVAREAISQWNAGGRQESEDDLKRIIRDALDRLPSNNGNIGESIRQAVNAGYMKGMMDREADRKRIEQFTESFMQ